MYDPHKNPDMAGEATVMSKGRLVKARFPDQAPPNVSWFWLPLGNCHVCRYFAAPPECTNPKISDDRFRNYYIFTNDCPEFDAGIESKVAKDDPARADVLDVMKAVGIVKGTPDQKVDVILDSPWSMDLAARAHREQSQFLHMAAAADSGTPNDPSRGEYVDMSDDLEGRPAQPPPPPEPAQLSINEGDPPDIVSAPEIMVAGNGKKPAAAAVPKRVSVIRDWDTLKSVVVGRGDNDVIPAWYPSFDPSDTNEVNDPSAAGVPKADYAPNMQRRAARQQNLLVKLLEREGVQVLRPPLLPPEVAQADPVGLSQAWMREIFTVIGNRVVVGQCRAPHRNKDHEVLEPLLRTIEQSGLATVHRLPPCSLERDPDWENDARPFLEGGDIFRLGKDVVVTMSYLATSPTGYRWLADLLAPDGVEVWPAYLDGYWEHGDYVFMPVREGLCVAYLKGFKDGLLPAPCTDWDCVTLTRDEADNKFAANGLVLRPDVLLLPAGCPRVVRALERKGVDVIEVPFDGPIYWEGGIDCSVSELWRG